MEHGQAPNLFELRGTDGTQVTYSTISASGAPTLSYSLPMVEGSCSGDHIRRSDTALGSVVTVWRKRDDGESLLPNLLLPPFAPANRGASSFDTIVILTTKRSSFSCASPVAAFRSEPVALSGEAKFVEF